MLNYLIRYKNYKDNNIMLLDYSIDILYIDYVHILIHKYKNKNKNKNKINRNNINRNNKSNNNNNYYL